MRNSTQKLIKIGIIETAVKNLKNFGYPNVNSTNIFTDEIYKSFFLKMLENNIGIHKPSDSIINELILEIKK